MASTKATRADVARLFGRAAFGATAADLDAWTGKPYADAVDALVSAGPSGGDQLDGRRYQTTSDRTFGNERESGNAPLRRAQGWWLERMRTTGAPLAERMTLLWHGHFATARKSPFPDTAMLVEQNRTIYTHALGSFRSLVVAMNVDPAMLFWLDGTISSRPVPNENHARELLELFILGKFPQVYSETDVREAARALTGWVADATLRQSGFDPNRHDAGRKRILGRDLTNLAEREHEAVVDAALAQPVASRYIAYKLVRELAYDPGRDDLLRRPDPLVAKVADSLRTGRWDLRAAVRTLLLSDEFRSPGRTRQGVRTPVELVVHAGKALGVGIDDDHLVAALAGMGHRVFDPNHVGGWPFGEQWLSPVSTIARYAFAARISQLATQGFFGVQLASRPAAADLAGWARLLGVAGWSTNTERTVRNYVSQQKTMSEGEKQLGVIVLLLASPDWLVQ